MSTKPRLSLQCDAPLLSNKKSTPRNRRAGTPLFETLEAAFADCNDSENEYLDDSDIDDDDYEYDTDEDWKSEHEDDDNDLINESVRQSVTDAFALSLSAVAPKKQNQNKSKPINSVTSLSSYKHFTIRQLTVYGDISNHDHEQKSEERERDLIKKEIIETEISYLKGLRVLLNEFIKPIFEQKMIPLKYEREVTSVIPMIINLHSEFLKELQSQYKGDGDLSSVFIKCADYFKIYNDYIACYHNILDIFAKHNHKSKKLKKYLKQKRTQRKPLANHLILPIQRIPRYLLLLQDLKKKTPATHDNYGNLCTALALINKVAVSINESKREIENMSQCLQVMESLRELNRNIVEPHRKFLAQFLFRKKDNGRPRQFFVFSDLIIITNVKFKVKMIVEMRTLDLKITDDPQIFSLFSAKGKPIQYQTEDTVDSVDDIIALHQMIIKSRMAVWDSYLSHLDDGKSPQRDSLKKSGVSQAQQYRNQLETLERLREKKDESRLNLFRKSTLIKGKKDKVLEMLGQ